jgi:hypothetical protein
MSETIFDLTKVLLPGILISMFTAIITVRLSLKRFYSERLWERKMNSYTSIFEALYRLKHYYQLKRDIDLRERNLRENKADLLEQQWEDGDMEVSKAIDIGSFVICQEAINCLQDYRKKRRLDLEYNDIVDVASQEIEYLNECITTLKYIAHKDLGVSNKKKMTGRSNIK